MHTYTPFCIIAIAHSRWTLCEHGRIWQPLKASWNKEPINEIKKKMFGLWSNCHASLSLDFHSRNASTWRYYAQQVNKTKLSARLIASHRGENLLEDISPIPYSYSALMSNYVTTSKQMQHSSCPEFARQECFPSSRLSRQTLHTSQWKERSL